jgi:hypothetical protein
LKNEIFLFSETYSAISLRCSTVLGNSYFEPRKG